MYINPILHSYSAEKYDEINKDYKNLTSRFVSKAQQVDKNESVFSINTKREVKDLTDYIHENQLLAEELKQRTDIGEAIPILGKLNSVVEKIKDNDYIPASGIVSLALLNGPEDIREVLSSYKQIKAFVQGKKYEKPYDYKKAQHPFSFFRGTLLNDFVNPFSEKCKFPKIANNLLKWDKSLVDTELGRELRNRKNIDTLEFKVPIEDTTSTMQNKKYVRAYQFNSPDKFGNHTARAMTRTPVIGLAFSSAMEAAHLIKEVKEGDDFLMELGKSTVRLASSAMITGYLGAIGSKFGPTGSLIGMGLGAILNAKVERLTD